MAAGTDIFISYKREERALAEAYADAFRKHGFLVVTDLNIPSATRFDDAIDTMIREATLVVALWTPAAAGSNPVRNEAIEALNQGKYLGVIAKPTDPESLPLSLRHNQFVNVSTKSTTAALAEVTREVTARIREKRAEAKAKATQDDELAEDMEFYANVNSIGELSGYRLYLKRYPTGVYREEAQSKIAAITHWSTRVSRYLGSPSGVITSLFTVIGALATVYAVLGPDPVSNDGRAQIEKLQAEASDRQDQLAALEETNAGIRQERADLQARLAQANRDLQAEASDLQEQLAALEKTNAGIRQERADLQARLAQANRDLQAARQADPAQLADLRREKQVLNQQLAEAKGEAVRLQGELNNLRLGVRMLSSPKNAPEPPDEDIQQTQPDRVFELFGIRLKNLSEDARVRFDISDEVQGVLIDEVLAGSSAAEKGVSAGDVVVEVGQEPVSSPSDVERGVNDGIASGRKSVLFLMQSVENLRFVLLALPD